jgi:flagellar basal-body rod protein FlgF
MDRGSYAAASGGMAQLRLLDTVTNNLANINTVGFKQDVLVQNQQRFEDTLASGMATDVYAKGDHDRTPGAFSVESAIDFTPGPARKTNEPLDVTLRKANDFFVVLTPEGPQLTRAGNFTLDATGTLVTSDGFPVSGGGGSITVTGARASISPGGAVQAGGVTVGQIQVMQVADTKSLEKLGSNRFKIKEDQPNGIEVTPDLETGTLESANISMTSAMVQMISAHRGFQAYTKVAGAIDEMNKDAVTQIVSRR